LDSREWYTYLEQGRDIQVSTEVLDSLSRVLQLDKNERSHLYLLATRQYPPEEKRLQASIKPNLQNFLNELILTPAYVTDERLNVIAWNKAFCAVYGDYQLMNERERNLVWITFTSSYFREIKREHREESALRCLAQFRAGYGRYVEDTWWSEQILELSGISQEFKAMWQHQEVTYAPEGHKIIYHPTAGSMVFEYLAFSVADSSELQIVINTPVSGTETAERVKMLLS
jgi:PAS domain-containing protein